MFRHSEGKDSRETIRCTYEAKLNQVKSALRKFSEEQYWHKGIGPIFFYTGNQDDIEVFQTATGLLTDLAPKMGAMVVFGEHRYYGKSLPFGEKSFDSEHIGLLTIEQALADYAYLLEHLREVYNASNAPVITFGGSYGGILSAYMRMKYPNLVTGALSSSAPLYWATGHGDRHGFWKSVTEIFGSHSAACVDRVREGFKETASLASMNKYNEISQAFHTCNPVTKDTLKHLYRWVRDSFSLLAMMNFPYPARILGQLPGYPVNTACDMILNGKTAIEGLAAGAGILYDATGENSKSVECFNIVKGYGECADPTGCGLGNAVAWNYQVCTEIVLPGGTNNVTDMFPPLPFTLEMRTNYCEKHLGVTPRNHWLSINYWTEDLKAASNIIFSNGDMDPWHNGGVLHDLSLSLPALIVKGGAHCFDLSGSNPKDTESVKAVREKEGFIIMGWIQQYWMKRFDI